MILLLLLLIMLVVIVIVLFFVYNVYGNKQQSKKRILFLLLHTQEKESLKDTIIETWISHLDPKYEQALFLVCKTEPNQISNSNDTIVLTEDLKDDGLDVVLHKTLYGFRHVLKHYQFDYLVRSNNGETLLCENFIKTFFCEANIVMRFCHNIHPKWI
jgi:hypothetical protein